MLFAQLLPLLAFQTFSLSRTSEAKTEQRLTNCRVFFSTTCSCHLCFEKVAKREEAGAIPSSELAHPKNSKPRPMR